MELKMGKTIFALGTGRCGTVFLYKVFSKEPKVASHHERHPLSDAFHRYVKWNDLPVDDAGFLAIKEAGVLNLSLIHISEPTRPPSTSRMPSSA